MYVCIHTCKIGQYRADVQGRLEHVVWEIANLVHLYASVPCVPSGQGVCGCVRLADNRNKSSLDSVNFLGIKQPFMVMSQGLPINPFSSVIIVPRHLEVRAGSLAGDFA